MKILAYTPTKKQNGNFIGYLKLEINCLINGKTFPMSCDVSIMRNSNNGHLFVNWPAKPFQTPEGTTKYAPLMRWVREQVDEIQTEVINEFQKYIANKNQSQTQIQSVQKQEYTPPDYPDATQGEFPF
jgi:hypothetical protein